MWSMGTVAREWHCWLPCGCSKRSGGTLIQLGEIAGFLLFEGGSFPTLACRKITLFEQKTSKRSEQQVHPAMRRQL